MATSDMFILLHETWPDSSKAEIGTHTYRQYDDLVILAPFLKEGKWDKKKCIVVIQN
jgi:hypothetical protein